MIRMRADGRLVHLVRILHADPQRVRCIVVQGQCRSARGQSVAHGKRMRTRKGGQRERERAAEAESLQVVDHTRAQLDPCVEQPRTTATPLWHARVDARWVQCRGVGVVHMVNDGTRLEPQQPGISSPCAEHTMRLHPEP